MVGEHGRNLGSEVYSMRSRNREQLSADCQQMLDRSAGKQPERNATTESAMEQTL